MRHVLISAFCLLSAGFAVSPATAQDLRAVTEDGRKVLLSNDGKWRFDNRTVAPAPLPSSPYQTAVGRFKVAYNAQDWRLMPKKDEAERGKRSFEHRTLPIHAVVIADEMPGQTTGLRDIILFNARNFGAETTVLFEETTKVSGRDVGYIRFLANIKSLEFIFSTYYYADEGGNIQVTCLTGQSMFVKVQAECQKFLDGLQIQ